MTDDWELAGLDPFALLDDEAGRLDGFLSGLSGSGWTRASRCAGWTVRDVLGHLAAGEDYHRACLDGTVAAFLASFAGRGGTTWTRSTRSASPATLPCPRHRCSPAGAPPAQGRAGWTRHPGSAPRSARSCQRCPDFPAAGCRPPRSVSLTASSARQRNVPHRGAPERCDREGASLPSRAPGPTLCMTSRSRVSMTGPVSVLAAARSRARPAW